MVTGTLSQGTFSTGDEVTIVPSGLSAHVRSLESYKKETRRAEPGSRVAVNLAGIKREDVKRGDIVVSSAMYAPLSRTVDIDLKMLADAGTSLKNMAEVLVYMETRELLARVSLIAVKTLKPGDSCLAQLRFQEDVAAFVGERFIVRQQSPAKTIGGGVVLDPQASRFKLAEIPARLALLEKRRSLNLDELILAELTKSRFVEAKTLLAASLFSQTEISGHVKHLVSLKKLVQAGTYVVDGSIWQNASLRLLSKLEKELATDTLRSGVSQAAIQGVLGLPREVFDALVQQMVSTGKLARQEDTLLLPRSKPSLSQQQAALRMAVLNLFAKTPATPPTLKELTIQLPASTPVVHYMIKQGELVELPDGILLEAKQFQKIQDEVMNILKQSGHISIQNINARFGFSRKYSVPLLTHLDRLGITRREGDVRLAGKKLA